MWKWVLSNFIIQKVRHTKYFKDDFECILWLIKLKIIVSYTDMGLLRHQPIFSYLKKVNIIKFFIEKCSFYLNIVDVEFFNENNSLFYVKLCINN